MRFLEFSEVVVEIQTYGWREEVTRWASAVKLILFRDAVFTQGLAHVQIYAIVLPGVACCMGIVAQVSLENLIQSLLRANLLRKQQLRTIWLLKSAPNTCLFCECT